MPESVSPDNKAIAKIVAASFGGTPKVEEFHDDLRRSTVAILTAANSPVEHFMSFCTIGLSDVVVSDNLQPPLGSEVCGVNDDAAFAHVLAAVAFACMHDQARAEPDSIFEGVVSAYFSEASVPHVLLVSPPYHWEGLDSQTLSTKTVGWLLAVPISDAEMNYAAKNGVDALTDIFDQQETDISHLHRSSVV